jgi:nucleoside-diphosphate-sugar epimerase
MNCELLNIAPDEPILVTGSAGFIGSRVVQNLLDRGFRHVRCLVRPSSNVSGLAALAARHRDGARIDVVRGNLLSREDCARAVKDAAVVFHLAAARGEKSVPDAFMNSVVTTRNLLDASVRDAHLRRLVSISSFAVYTNMHKPRWRRLDETCPIERHPERRGDAYCFAKTKQDELVMEYGKKFDLPYVLVRPGWVYGPGNANLTGRVGIGTFGLFLHLGGSNPVPMTFVDNCAEVIVRAGLTAGVDGQVFNVVDDDLPSSRRLLHLYKRHVRRFTSVYVPHAVSYLLCYLWESYSSWSQGQLPPAFNRGGWHAYWKRTRYSNEKAKALLGWTPQVTTEEGLRRYFESCRMRGQHA